MHDYCQVLCFMDSRKVLHAVELAQVRLVKNINYERVCIMYS